MSLLRTYTLYVIDPTRSSLVCQNLFEYILGAVAHYTFESSPKFKQFYSHTSWRFVNLLNENVSTIYPVQIAI